ncbi:MAG: TatA/E family twin arginine-targeting protein translocase [Leptolyngbyaceae cyanobacterium]
MNFFGIGLPEMALILVLALLVFGPKKLPEIGSSLAKALKSFQKAQQDFEAELKKEAEQIQKTVTEPMKASIEKPEPKALSPQDGDDETLDLEDASNVPEPSMDASETIPAEVETSEEVLPN